MGTRGDKFSVIYVDGDVPQLPIQLGQLLVDTSLVSPGNVSLKQCTDVDPVTYEVVGGGGSGAPVTFRGTFSSPVGALTTAAPRAYMRVPAGATITRVTLLTQGGTGSCVVDVRTGAYGSFPTVASICAAAKPTISGGVAYSDSTLTGWTTLLSSGDVIAFVLESVSTFTTITIQIDATL